MVKKIFLCLLAGLVMNGFAMSDSDEETVDRTPKDVTILLGKTLEQTVILTKEDIARKYCFLSACSMASRSELPRIELPPDISFAALDTALELTWSFRKAWGHNLILSPERLQTKITPEMIAPVLRVLLRLGARTDLIVAIGLLARDPDYKRSLQESLAESPTLQKELFEKTGTALTICHTPFLKKSESMPKNSIDRLARLTNIWEDNKFFLKLVSVPVALIPGPVLAAVETQAGVGEMALKSGEVQTEAPVRADASAATDTVSLVDNGIQACIATNFGETQTEAPEERRVRDFHSQTDSLSGPVLAANGVQTEALPAGADASAATEPVEFVDKVAQTSVATNFGETQTEAPEERRVCDRQSQTELIPGPVLAANGVQTEALPAGADASAATEPVEFVDKVSQAECPSAAACAQTERRALVLSESVSTCDIAPTKRKSFEMSDFTMCDIAPRELADQSTQTDKFNRPITKNIWQKTANLGIGEAMKWQAINKKLDKKSNPAYIMAQTIAKKKKPVEVVASAVQTEEVTHAASPLPASLLFVPDRATNLRTGAQKYARDKKLGGVPRVIIPSMPVVPLSQDVEFVKPMRKTRPLLWPTWFSQFFSRWLPTPAKPISSDEPMRLPVAPSDKINVDAVLRPAKFLLLAAKLS